MTRWVQTYWDEEDVTFYWEVGADGWVTRSIELAGPTKTAQAAAALDEWTRELDAGRIENYQRTYGVLADQPITDWTFPHVDIDQKRVRRSLALRPSSARGRATLTGMPSGDQNRLQGPGGGGDSPS